MIVFLRELPGIARELTEIQLHELFTANNVTILFSADAEGYG